MPQNEKRNKISNVEITPEMIEAGESVISVEVGVPGDLVGGFFDARETAIAVYRAMRSLDYAKTNKGAGRSHRAPPRSRNTI
jgi:hypothetical protein